GGLARGRGGIADRVGELRNVLRVSDIEDEPSVPADVVGSRKPRREGMVVGDEEAAAVFPVVLVVADSDIEAQVLVEVDFVVEEDRVGHEVRALRVLEDRRPADEGRISGRLENRKDVVSTNVGARSEDPEVTARLVVVREPEILEMFIAQPDVVASGGGRR